MTLVPNRSAADYVKNAIATTTLPDNNKLA